MTIEEIAQKLFDKHSRTEDYEWDDLPIDHTDKIFWRDVVKEVKECLES